MASGAPMSGASSLTVVLPAFDEAKVIGETVRRVGAAVSVLGTPFDLIVVDDGSGDGTREAAEAALATLGAGRVLRLEGNRGKGAAVKAGMLAAPGSRRAFLDADLSVDPGYLRQVLDALDGGADVVLASRRLPESRLERHQPWIREAMGTVYRTTASIFITPGISDFTCGLKGFTAAAAERLFGLSRMPRFGFDVEILYLASRLGLSIVEIPVSWSDVPDTRVRIPVDTLRSLVELASVPWNAFMGRYGQLGPARRPVSL